jgi:penicillin-binding protein 2
VLQLAMAYAALGNGGTLFAPQVVRTIETSSPEGTGTVEVDFPPRVRRKVTMSPDHWRFVIDAMHGVVNDPEGTAYRERTTKVDIAGKTGTAQVSRITQKAGVDPHTIGYFNRDHAWFAGFAPYNDPEIAIAVLVEHGGGGGHNAAPIAMRLFEDWFLRLKPAGGAGHKPSALKPGAPGAPPPISPPTLPPSGMGSAP